MAIRQAIKKAAQVTGEKLKTEKGFRKVFEAGNDFLPVVKKYFTRKGAPAVAETPAVAQRPPIVAQPLDVGNTSRRWKGLERYKSCLRGKVAIGGDESADNDTARFHNDMTRSLGSFRTRPRDPSSSSLLMLMEEESRRNANSQTGGAVANPFTVTVEETLSVALNQNGGVISFDLTGTLSLQFVNQNDGFVQVQIEISGNHPDIRYRTHPELNSELFPEGVLSFKKPEVEAFPAGVCPLMKWRLQRADPSMVPLTISLWPMVYGNKTHVSIWYEASSMFDLTDVIISVPLPPALGDSPTVTHCDGDFRYDSRRSLLVWSTLPMDNSNLSGSMEFVVPPVDSEVFFPVSIQFASTSTYSGLKVTGMIPQRGGDGGFVQSTQLTAQRYQILS